MTTIFAIDPGPVESAYVILINSVSLPSFGKIPNADLRLMLRDTSGLDFLVIEKICSYGMAVGQDVFDTCYAAGRFHQAYGGTTYLLPRKTVVTHLCNDSRGNDSSVRTALIDRFGGKAKAIGTKAYPGKLYGVVKDSWSALAIAVTAQNFIDQGKLDKLHRVA